MRLPQTVGGSATRQEPTCVTSFCQRVRQNASDLRYPLLKANQSATLATRYLLVSATLFKFPKPASKCFPINPFTPTKTSMTFIM
jgi:hypothetical protein